MRKFKLFSVLVLLALVLSAGSGAVLAQEPPPNRCDRATAEALVEQLAKAGDEADEVFAQLSPEAQACALEYLKGKRVVSAVPEDTTALNGGCNRAQYEVWMENLYGVKLWSYFQQIDWCWDDCSEITSKTRLRWPEVYVPLWDFVDHIGNQESGGVGQWSYRAWTQGHFQLCVEPWGCYQHSYPWIDMTVYGNGAWSGTGGG